MFTLILFFVLWVGGLLAIYSIVMYSLGRVIHYTAIFAITQLANTFKIPSVKVLRKIHFNTKVVSIVFLIYFVVAAIWYYFAIKTVPFNWHIYEKHSPVKYSFAYPPNWIISECGDGEIVAARVAVAKCEDPLSMTDYYKKNLYFQVFRFDNYDFVNNTKEQASFYQQFERLHWKSYYVAHDGVVTEWFKPVRKQHSSQDMGASVFIGYFDNDAEVSTIKQAISTFNFP